jgi:hypothetical protein
MIRHGVFIIIAWIWALCLLLAVESQAAESLEEVRIPQALSAGLHHFLDLADPAKTVAFDPKKVAGVLDFINQPGKDAALYYADSILGAPSAYYEFDIHENLKKIVAYSFNPDIPDIATVPSSVRLIGWMHRRTANHRRVSGSTWIGLILLSLSMVFNIWKLHRTPIRALTMHTTCTTPCFFLSIANATSWLPFPNR